MFKISKLLQALLGFSGFLRMGIVDGDGGSSEPLDANGAATAFSSLLGGEGLNESEAQNEETPEAAAERLATQELSGDEDGAAPEGEAAVDEANADDVTIEVDGKSVKLTKAELAEHYKNGLRQQDYTRKTMEVAEVRKTAEAEAQQARQEREKYGEQLQMLAHQLQGALQQEPDIALIDSDPVEYMRQKHQYESWQANLQQVYTEQQRVAQLTQAEQAESQRQYLQQQHQALLDKLPEWKDEGKAKAEKTAIAKHLLDRGFTEQELQSISDHRLLLLARDAMRHSDLITRAKEAAKKVSTLPVKVERSGSPDASKPDPRADALKRLGRTGSIGDAANAFSQILK